MIQRHEILQKEIDESKTKKNNFMLFRGDYNTYLVGDNREGK